MALADSAVHMIGADYLIHHGQSYAHLDLANSYGQFINDYYNTSYPSGADTLFGGSALLLRLPLIWAFQPFNAFLLATAWGPAWLLARRMRLSGPWATLAALTAVLPALVYGYELIGSVKEMTALSMLLAPAPSSRSTPPGCADRAAARSRSRSCSPRGSPRSGSPSACGRSWWWSCSRSCSRGELAARRVTPAHALAMVALAAVVGLLAALPTWAGLSGSAAGRRRDRRNQQPGQPPHAAGSHPDLRHLARGQLKLAPGGNELSITHLLIALAFAAALLGAVQVLRIRALALAGWLALTLLAWLIVTESVTTWASAKTLMLTSPVVVLLAWGGVAALRELRPRALAGAAAGLWPPRCSAGVLVSDAMQYRSSDLAPTARYQELASLGSRFAGRGPALFTDFDEYALYELRDLDVGGPDFVYPPPALAAAAGGYGNPSTSTACPRARCWPTP